MRLQIEYIDPRKLKTDKKNARKHGKADLAALAKSIEQFDFIDPVGVWGDELLIVEGHGRVQAAKKRGVKEIPIIRLDHLSDEERKAYALAHNRTAELSTWDFDALEAALSEIPNIDMEPFKLDLSFDGKMRQRKRAETHTSDEDPLPRLQHDAFENFEKGFYPQTAGRYDIPVMERTETTGTEFLRFCDWRDVESHGGLIAHFYYDDYKFMSAWRDPDRYVERLRGFKAVISPDFSLYTDFPRALQILSCYRRQWVGAYWQSLGLDVIPDVVWGDEQSYEFCFDGIPEGGTVAVSSVGVARDAEWNGMGADMFKRGYDEMLKRIRPATVLFYGTMIEGLGGNIIRIPTFYEHRRQRLHGQRQQWCRSAKSDKRP